MLDDSHDASTSVKREREQLLVELSTALEHTPRAELEGWVARIPRTMGEVTLRRGINIVNLGKGIARLLADEGRGLLDAYRRQGISEHLAKRAGELKTSGAKALADARSAIARLYSQLRSDPKNEAPRFAAMLFGFLLGSGGADGDGGVPDLDLLGGIGEHRSIFTHSIVAGIVIETLILSLHDLTKTVYANLPPAHDPLWEKLIAGNEQMLLGLAQGISAGIAYHLGVDATLDDGGTLRDLPIAVSAEMHQTIIAANAAVEATDVVSRPTTTIKVDARDPTILTFKTYEEALAFTKRIPGRLLKRSQDGIHWTVREKARL
jgi:hypothetical protein